MVVVVMEEVVVVEEEVVAAATLQKEHEKNARRAPGHGSHWGQLPARCNDNRQQHPVGRHPEHVAVDEFPAEW